MKICNRTIKKKKYFPEVVIKNKMEKTVSHQFKKLSQLGDLCIVGGGM